MNAHLLSMDIIEDQSVKGFSSIVENASSLKEEDLAVELKDASRHLGAGLPGDQNIVGDLYRKIVSRVRGRQLVKDYGDHEIDIEWLCLHVPPGGIAHMQISSSTEKSLGIKFSIVGNGLGDGWSFKANLHDDFLERSKCMSIVETFKIHVRGFAYEDSISDIEYRCDVIERVKTSIREAEECPFCGQNSHLALMMTEKAGPEIDLSKSSVGQKKSEKITVTGNSELELGLDTKILGDINVSAGVSYRREVSFTCAVDYTFSPGYVYQPMRRFQYADLPFWRTS
jgi:hypothetical protein